MATKERRARIVDVARHAGVSPQTVSNVINGRNGFTEPTRLKVERAIADLGFQPNRFAQSLRSHRTGLIGFDMVRQQLDVSNPFTVGLLHSLVPAAASLDRRVLVFTHEEGRPEEFHATATAGLVDGFILSDSTAGDIRAQVLQDLGVPFVVMGRPVTRDPIVALDIDNVAAMRLAVSHVVAQGCRDVAYIGYGGSAHWNVDRRQGARIALRESGITLPRHRQLTGTTLKSIRSRLPGFLTSNGVPDAVVTSSDSIAMSVVATASVLGIEVGKDLAVTGFDNGPLATMVSPEITSVAVPVEPIAKHLLEMLELLLGGQPVPQVPDVATKLVIRASSGFAPARGR